jgi:membrane associated rhomboid family serine protease
MNKKFGLFILVGLAIGASLGVFIGAAIGNVPLAIAVGAIGGLFLGWFVAAAVLEKEKSKKSK